MQKLSKTNPFHTQFYLINDWIRYLYIYLRKANLLRVDLLTGISIHRIMDVFSVYIVNQRTQIKQQIFNLTIGKCLESIPGAQMFTVIDKMSAHMVPKWISIRSEQNKIFAILPKVSLCINNINCNRNN